MAKTLFLGVEGSGKTTLSMALARAFARHAAEGWYLRPHDRGAYGFATIAPEDFARDGFPRQTANVREMTWRIERNGADCGALEILDYPGEVYRLAFLDADGEPDPVAFRERAEANAAEIARLRAALDAAERVFVLFNLQDALDLRGNDANRAAMWVTNESLKAVRALPSKPQVTLVFTQVDRYQTADDFLHSFTPRDLDLVGHDHPDVDWTMVSVMVPPESEFGVDAFVRRCTGFADFGVPTGRPGDAAAQSRGAALRGLAASLNGAPAADGRVSAPGPDGGAAPGAGIPAPVAAAPGSAAGPAGGSSAPRRRRLALALGGTVFAALLLALAGAEALHGRALRRQRLAEQARVEAARKAEAERKAAEARRAAEEEARRAEAARIAEAARKAEESRRAEEARRQAEARAKKAEEVRRAEAARKAEAAKRAAEEEARRAEAARKAEAERRAAEAKARAEAERRRREAAERSHPTAASDALAGRLAAGAWTAWTENAARMAARRAAAVESLGRALASASPQEAHEALCDAAEAGLGAAQERLAQVYDIWGWGGWVRAREDAGAMWTRWLRRIDFPNGGKAFSVSRPAPNAEEFRRLALDWYRTAAANGVASAAEALRRHGETPPQPETPEAARALARDAEEDLP